MTKTLLASAAVLLFATVSYAAIPTQDNSTGLKSATISGDLQEAKRRKQRVPGGSGCDDQNDIAEHPECAPPTAASLFDTLPVLEKGSLTDEAKRRKRRIPGGSGCDDPRDLIEHPECRV